MTSPSFVMGLGRLVSSSAHVTLSCDPALAFLVLAGLLSGYMCLPIKYPPISRLGLKGFSGVDSDGFSGGLALYWHESIYVDVKEQNERYIDVWMRVSPHEPLVMSRSCMENQEWRIAILCGLSWQYCVLLLHSLGLLSETLMKHYGPMSTSQRADDRSPRWQPSETAYSCVA